MSRTNAISLLGATIKRVLLLLALPRIVEFPPAEWRETLKRARVTNFDMIEKSGILAGVVFVTYLLRPDVAQTTEISLTIQYLSQFLAALPLLFLFAGPFYLRRLRRGLDHEIERRRVAGQFEPLRRHHHD